MASAEPYGPTDPAKRRSAALTDGVDRAAARAMLKGTGFTDADLARPLVGVATTWIETMPCNLNQRVLARYVKQGIRRAGGTPIEFNTISVSDGVSMGTEGMRASLVSREVIADSIEVVGAHAAGTMTSAEVHALESVACPGAGACGGQFTANTMALVLDFLGISSPGLNEIPATHPGKPAAAVAAGQLAMKLVREDVRASQLITRETLENAVAAVAGTGGSTNGILHLLAIAREVGVELTLDEVDAIASRTPIVADLV